MKENIRSPLMRYLFRLMDIPPYDMNIFNVCGTLLTVGLLLPLGLLHEKIIRLREAKVK